ncbi:leishmanolysin-related zinc metalloendopeptidase [Streptomyces hygroscopicus]|uniref:leishmanolysin-related zinc metalloendopeptidase n=1 Tax=Streptomyces hygroscopicus TaxID=1912 RepID=UPI003F1C4741
MPQPQISRQVKDWEPIRIVASTKDLEVHQSIAGKRMAQSMNAGSQGADSDCKPFFLHLTAEKITIVMGILEKAIALHTDRLLVQRAVGPLKIPDFSKHPHCKYFNVPAEHHTTGVANADMVLYVGAARESGDDVDEAQCRWV